MIVTHLPNPMMMVADQLPLFLVRIDELPKNQVLDSKKSTCRIRYDSRLDLT